MDESHRDSPPRRPSKRPRVLVACQRCKARRQKCDNASPACSNCSRASAACVYGDNNAYPPSYVKALEERLRQLEARLKNDAAASSTLRRAEMLSSVRELSSVDMSSPPSHTAQGDEVGAGAAGDRRSDRLALGLGLLSSCAAAEPHYFGFSAGLSLAHFVQVAIDLGSSSDVQLPLLADRPFTNHLSDSTTLAPLPSFRTGATYIRAYLAFIHPLYPFFNRNSLWRLHGQLTRREEAEHHHHHYHGRGPRPVSGSGSGPDSGSSHASPIDLTRMHLVYAIGSRCLQLLGKPKVSKSTPEGHFLSAMKIISDDLKFTSARSIEVTLLLAIHSMRAPAGTSVWHLAGLAIRQCLELGLHKQRKVDSQSVGADQYRKRLFWSAYIFERKTALVLGRPFALSDDEIDLGLPLNADDDENEERNLVAALAAEAGGGTGGDVGGNNTSLRRTSLSYHRAHVELYQLHTQIRLALYQMRRTQTKEQAREKMAALFAQLESWKTQALELFDPQRPQALAQHTTTAPSQAPPTRGGIGDSTTNDSDSSQGSDQDGGSGSGGAPDAAPLRTVEIERAELLLEYHKARRSLLQPLMTEGRDCYPFDVADYTACADASGQICQLYRRLHRLSPVPFSLRDLHAVFVAGFTLIYCVCNCPAIYSARRASDVGACSTVLYVITEQWASAKKYRDAFEVVAEKMLESAARVQADTAPVSSSMRPSYYDTEMQGMSASGPGPGQQVHQPARRASTAATTTTTTTIPAATAMMGVQQTATAPAAAACQTTPVFHSPATAPTVASSMDGHTGTPSTIYEGRASETPQPQPQFQPLPMFPPAVPTAAATASASASITAPYCGPVSAPLQMSSGIGLDLEADLYDIEGLLSNEGLEWFTDAVL